ncbi:hypothetical protein RV10_GL002864 [Enterococcus pallens]|nr:hypothetical protein RV10_GL002864 [Enterococcus pallens]
MKIKDAHPTNEQSNDPAKNKVINQVLISSTYAMPFVHFDGFHLQSKIAQ